MLLFVLAYQKHIYTGIARSWDGIYTSFMKLHMPEVTCQLSRNTASKPDICYADEGLYP